MKKSITKKKFLIIIAVILFLGITVPQIASAQSLAEFVKDPGRSIVRACTEWLLAILRWTVDTAADFFEAMLDLGFQGHQKIAKVGWDVSRDIANMCFILFMVIIAFATILRFERYGIKELLPKVIMIALLINFSMVICYVIIDFTNIIANFFITDAKNAVPNPPGQEGINISAILTDGFKLPELYTPFLCQQFVDDQEKCATLTPESAANNCMAQAERGLNECYQTDARNTQTEATNFWDALAAAFGTAIILAVATFVYLAGGVLLVGRLIIIWFLVMIAPLAFICYILPALRKNWQAWWSLFIKWCIFAPAYSFFIWLTCKIVLEDKLNNIAALKVSMSSKSGEAVNTFFASTGSLLHFLFVCGLLLGGLIASSQMGIRGASIAMTLGKKWTGATKGWIKKQTVGRAKERAEGGLDRARGGIMSGAGKLFGDTKIGRNLRARGTMAQQAAAGREYNKKYAARLSMMSREDTLKEVEKASGTQKLLAARTAQNRGYMREATNEQAQAAMKAYETFGDSEMLRKLEELRPDAIISKKGETTEKTEERRKDAEERAFSNGTYRQWSKQVLDKNKFGPQIIQEMRKQLSTGEFASVFKTWTKDVRSAAEESMQKTFTDDFAAKADGSDNDNVANRKALYRVTNNAEKTFYSDANGTVRPEWLEEGSAADIVAGQAVATTNAETMDKITPEASLKLAARHITSKQVPTLGYGMQNAKAKEVIRAEIDDLIIRQKAQLAMLDSSRSTAADAAALAETEAKMREVQTRIDDRTKIQNLMKKSGYWGGTEITPTP